MGSGGHARSGPAPDPNAIRRDRPADQATWITLPEPRTGPAPAWPLTEGTKREDAMWSRLWATSQARMWETLGLTDEVGLYVRTFCEAAAVEASAPLRTLVLRQMEGLGLSAAGLSRLRWRLPTGDPAPTKEATTTNDRRRSSTVKDRFKVVAIEDHRKAG